MSAQLAEDLSGGKLALTGYHYFDEHPTDDERTPFELLISQDLDLDFSETWKLVAGLEYRADTRPFVAGIIDEEVEESARRYYVNARELYLQYAGDKLDFRLGKQVFAWGKADSYNPTDNLNPYDYLDFLTSEKLGVVAASLGYSGANAGFDLVMVPRVNPSRIPTTDNRWFAQLQAFDPSSLPPFVIQDRQLPDNDLENAQYGLRFWGTAGGWDLALIAYHGFDTIPVVQITPDISGQFVNLTPVLNEIDEYGLALARAFGETSIHLEASYRETEEDFDDDFITWIVGMNRNFYVGGALEEIRLILEYIDESETTTKMNAGRVSSGLNRPFRDTLVVDTSFIINQDTSIVLRAALNLDDSDNFIQPLFKHAFSDSLKLETGLDLIDGDPGTFWGNWEANDRFFAQLLYFF
ncbi:MAG: hypothetical protein QNK37_14630 [Acidobacteriota bacterium]|nr:hypothetical protein [Acidobacteriota bacterium]